MYCCIILIATIINTIGTFRPISLTAIENKIITPNFLNDTFHVTCV